MTTTNTEGQRKEYRQLQLQSGMTREAFIGAVHRLNREIADGEEVDQSPAQLLRCAAEVAYEARQEARA